MTSCPQVYITIHKHTQVYRSLLLLLLLECNASSLHLWCVWYLQINILGISIPLNNKRTRASQLECVERFAESGRETSVVPLMIRPCSQFKCIRGAQQAAMASLSSFWQISKKVQFECIGAPVPFFWLICKTRLWPAFGRQSLVGSSGGYTSHGYTSHASPRACGARLGQIVKSV